MIIFYLRIVAMFVDMVTAWYQWKKKDISGVIFWCTLAIIMAIIAR